MYRKYCCNFIGLCKKYSSDDPIPFGTEVSGVNDAQSHVKACKMRKNVNSLASRHLSIVSLSVVFYTQRKKEKIFSNLRQVPLFCSKNNLMLVWEHKLYRISCCSKKIRLIEGNAKHRHLEKFPVKGHYGRCFICLRPRNPPPPPYTRVFTQGRGESWTRDKVRGA
jgi:hypothetical protein